VRARSRRGRGSSAESDVPEDGGDGDLMSELADDSDEGTRPHPARTGGDPSADARIDASTTTSATPPTAATTQIHFGTQPYDEAADSQPLPPQHAPQKFRVNTVAVEGGWNVLLQVSPGSDTQQRNRTRAVPSSVDDGRAKQTTAEQSPPRVVAPVPPPAVYHVAVGGDTHPGAQQPDSATDAGATSDQRGANERPARVRVVSTPMSGGRVAENLRSAGVQSFPDPGPRPARSGSSRFQWAAIAATLVVAIIIAAVVFVATRPDHPSNPVSGGTARTQAPPSSSASAGTLAGSSSAPVVWLTSNVDIDDRIGADPASATVLSKQGFTAVTPLTGSTKAVSGLVDKLDWLVWDASRRGKRHLASLFARSALVARFGTGRHGVQIRSVLPVGNVASLLAQDKNNRQLAGAGLAANPNVKVTRSVSAELQAGGFDLRAATFLAVLASTTMVDVVQAPQDTAERAASRPVRELVVAARPSSVRAALRSLPAVYQPRDVTEQDQQTTLAWDPAVNPVQPVS
jgi:hypothetical protein